MELKDRTKAMWQLINSATGKAQTENVNLELKVGDQITSNTTDITEGLNIHLISTVEKLSKHNIHSKSYRNLEINHCSNTVFIDPVSEDEVVNLSKNLKGKATAGYDDIPENLVKYCVYLIKKSLALIYNPSLNSGVFPDEWKVVKVKPLSKKCDRHEMNNHIPKQ